MFDKGFFGGLFDFNNDGKLDIFERAADSAAFAQLMSEDKKKEEETSFFDSPSFKSDFSTNDDDDILADAGLDAFDPEFMDDDERAEALEDAGLDPDDFDF